MKIINVNLEAVAVSPSGYPQSTLPEVAFVGRSNVGKSSLINCLIGRKSLARVSKQPGKTRTINFYNIDNSSYFVDLPGYGYAKAPKHEMAKWGQMIESYLHNRNQLKCIIQLIDIRHPPTALDIQMYAWLQHYGFKMMFVLTKLDKLKRSQVAKHIKIIRQALKPEPDANDDKILIPFSSETKEGKDKLLEAIGSIINS